MRTLVLMLLTIAATVFVMNQRTLPPEPSATPAPIQTPKTIPVPTTKPALARTTPKPATPRNAWMWATPTQQRVSRIMGSVSQVLASGLILDNATVSDDHDGELFLVNHPRQNQLADGASVLGVLAVRTGNCVIGSRTLRCYTFVRFEGGPVTRPDGYSNPLEQPAR